MFLVNVQNRVANLSSAQLYDIFSGKTKLWRLVGGADLPIMTLTRNEDLGSEELFGGMVLKGRKLPKGEPNTRISSMGQVIDRVAANRNAIGYSVFYFERFIAPRPENKLIAIDGILPTRQSIVAGTYPFVAPL